ncbi:hypothetical protein [Dorea formicigenerans]|nr:hypothetical protein [Dorea formicigenerans]
MINLLMVFVHIWTWSGFKEEQYDKLADGIRSHLDMERIYEIMKENVEEK